MLIILRGNSGSGKSTTAKLLRETAIERGGESKIAVVEQDYLRRIVLKEKETEGSNNIDLIEQTVKFALNRNYCVVLEGILYSKRYGAMIKRLLNKSSENFIYYFDVSFDETLKRHKTKPDSHEFGEKEMREWYRERDLLNLKGEQIIPEGMTQNQIVEKILADTKLI